MFDSGRVCHVWCNFEPGNTCRTTRIFGTLKDGSLQINSLPLKNCCRYRNVLQNGVNICQKCFLKTCFLSKSSTFCTFRTHDLLQILSAESPNTYVWRDFRLPVSVFTTVARMSFNGKFTAKIDFLIGHFMLQLLTLTLEVKSLSAHYLISVWSTSW